MNRLAKLDDKTKRLVVNANQIYLINNTYPGLRCTKEFSGDIMNVYSCDKGRNVKIFVWNESNIDGVKREILLILKERFKNILECFLKSHH